MRLIPAGNPESANPVVVVRWCLEPKDLATLRDRNVRNARILLVIAYDNRSEDRYLAPLEQVIEYLSFKRPGHHHVFGAIVWNSEGDVKQIERFYWKKVNSRTYDNDVLTYERNGLREDGDRTEAAEFEVTIPKEHFPKEPPAWLKRIVQWGYSYPAVDECEFRKRLSITPVKLFFAAIWAVITTFIRALLALIFGGVITLRGVDYKAIVRPWLYDIKEVLDDMESRSWAFHKENGDFCGWKSIVIFPPFYLVLYLVLLLTKHILHRSYLGAMLWYMRLLLHSVWWIGGIAVATGIVFLVVNAHRRGAQGDGRWEKERQRQLARDRAKRLAAQEREAELVRLSELLSCKTTPVVPALSAVPRAQRTFYLRYHNLKAKVCRPFAR
jgi:hypothetical protein